VFFHCSAKIYGHVHEGAGYMGQLIEWPEVITEGSDLEDCRASLKDAVEQMVLAYNEQKKEIPVDTV
jgi:predicted RNase H-like HicB family nuclease